MRPRKDQIDRIEKAFRAVYGKETVVSASRTWEDRVIRAVRRAAPQPARKSFDAEVLGRLVWRFAAATCLVALLLTAYVLTIEPGTASEVAKLFFEDPLAIDVVHALEAV